MPITWVDLMGILFIRNWLNITQPRRGTNLTKVRPLIDSENTIIKIDVDKHEILDSHRLFPVSLDSLNKHFESSVVKGVYDSDNFGSLDRLKDEKIFENFKRYALDDSISLLQSLRKGQWYYKETYSLDLTKCVSISNLAYRLYKTHYLADVLPAKSKGIPILSKTYDSFIRESYHGGSTDVYKVIGQGLKYYDVNSLYPSVMLEKMPFEALGGYHEVKDLNHFFGFVKVVVTAPKDLKYPVAALRH